MAGTPQYMSPEMLAEKGHDKLSDWWALGIVIFELATGETPWNNPDLEQLADEICFEDLPLRNEFSKDLRDLLLKLTHKIPSHRLGSKTGAAEIKAHPFFKTVQWDEVALKGLKPPIVPDPKVA